MAFKFNKSITTIIISDVRNILTPTDTLRETTPILIGIFILNKLFCKYVVYVHKMSSRYVWYHNMIHIIFHHRVPDKTNNI